ncbi:MAG: hypothetical protein R2875_07095 [Desulfobacterales bacterium]
MLKKKFEELKKEYKQEYGVGYVYILSNPAFPNYIKIGSTSLSPKNAVNSYRGQLGSAAFKLEWFLKVFE